MDLTQLKIDRAETSGNPGRRRSRAPIGWLVTLVLLVGVVVVFWKPLKSAVDGLRLPKVATIQAVRSNPRSASAVSGTAANGYIVAAKRAALSADTPGRIVELNVVEGSVVKKGQVVARLYSEEVRAQVQRAEADLLAAAASVERARAQREAAVSDLERLKAEVTRAEAAVIDPKLQRDWYALELARWRKLAEDNVHDRRTAEESASNLARAEATVITTEAAVAQARASLAQGESQVLALEAAVKEAQARIAIVEADRALALATLDKMEVRAPFDGVVVLKDAEVGEVVSPNSQGGNSRGSVATMVDWSSLEVQVELQETSLESATIGEAASIFLDAYPERRYGGHVLRIWPTANRQKATVEVRVGFDAPDEFLRPEMGARVVFSSEAEPIAEGEAPGEPSILIPTSAVVPIGGSSHVFVLERDLARAREVTLGAERSGRVQVISGLEGGETLVNSPPNSLADGDRVRIKE